jgi:hypothetical protein
MLPLGVQKPGMLARKSGSMVSCHWRWCRCEVEADALGPWRQQVAPTRAGRAAVGVEESLVQLLKREMAEAALQDGVGAVVEGTGGRNLRGTPTELPPASLSRLAAKNM